MEVEIGIISTWTLLRRRFYFPPPPSDQINDSSDKDDYQHINRGNADFIV
jgi:hypothetical protein